MVRVEEVEKCILSLMLERNLRMVSKVKGFGI
jgi:hypothetical protein